MHERQRYLVYGRLPLFLGVMWLPLFVGRGRVVVVVAAVLATRMPLRLPSSTQLLRVARRREKLQLGQQLLKMWRTQVAAKWLGVWLCVVVLDAFQHVVRSVTDLVTGLLVGVRVVVRTRKC